MKLKLAFFLIFGILIIAFNIYYPSKFQFYEQVKAKKIIDFIVLPIYGMIIIITMIRRFIKSESQFKIILKSIFIKLFLFGLIYFSILRSFMANGILFANASFGSSSVIVSGIVSAKVEIGEGERTFGRYELTVLQENKIYIFATTEEAIKKYSIGSAFEIEMQKGSLNLLFK